MIKKIIIYLVFILLISCSEEEEKVELLNVKINGRDYSFNGIAQKYTIKNDEHLSGVEYHLYNLEQPGLYLQVFDSTCVKKNFKFPGFSAFYGLHSTGDVPKNYHAINGTLQIHENKGVISGQFSFDAVNSLDFNDTLGFRNGYFQITLENLERTY
jgi:hypothetical protein